MATTNPTLLTIPQELRDKIYEYILQSSTKLVLFTHSDRDRTSSTSTWLPSAEPRYLKRLFSGKQTEIFEATGQRELEQEDIPWHVYKMAFVYRTFYPVEGNMSQPLSILRTCRKIHVETRHLFWHLNAVYLQPFYFHDFSLFLLNLPIQHVFFDVAHLHNNITIKKGLRNFLRWSRERRVKSINFYISGILMKYTNGWSGGFGPHDACEDVRRLVKAWKAEHGFSVRHNLPRVETRLSFDDRRRHHYPKWAVESVTMDQLVARYDKLFGGIGFDVGNVGLLDAFSCWGF